MPSRTAVSVGTQTHFSQIGSEFCAAVPQRYLAYSLTCRTSHYDFENRTRTPDHLLIIDSRTAAGLNVAYTNVKGPFKAEIFVMLRCDSCS